MQKCVAKYLRLTFHICPVQSGVPCAFTFNISKVFQLCVAQLRRRMIG